MAYKADIKNNLAEITISSTIKNSTGSATIKVVHELFDAEGRKLVSTSKSGQASAKALTEFSQVMKLRSPALWSIDSPYLYSLKTSVYKGSDLIDENIVKAGFRDIKFDPDKGFYLNGVNTKLKGVCIHHDAGVLGAAVTKSVWRTRLELSLIHISEPTRPY